MTPSGPAIYFDGMTSARHSVLVEASNAALRIVAADGGVIDEWPYAELRRHSAPEGILRLGRTGQQRLARIEVRNPALVAEIDSRADTLDASGAREQRARLKVVGWSLAAIASLVTGAIFGVPALATRLAPIVPVGVEQNLGNAVEKQIRIALDTRHLGAAFECGEAVGEREGRAALEKLVARLESVADLPFRLRVMAVRKSDFNAFALPGGHIYVYQGLIAKAETPDELAGTLAHEMGHVAQRDGTRAVLQAAGLSFLFGMLLGDFVGGGAVVIAAKTVLRSSYSREVEASADAYGVTLMGKAGGDPHALGTILARMVSDKEHSVKILHDHPETKDRIAAINAMKIPTAGTPLLDPAEWRALKQICSERRTSQGPPARDDVVRADDGATAHR